MTHNQDRLWSAYLDGELGAAEAAEFDRALAPRDRERLAGEMRLENALGDALRGREACPEALWQDVQKRIRTRPAGSRLRRWGWPLGIAAALAVSTAMAAVWVSSRPPEFLVAESIRYNPDITVPVEDLEPLLDQLNLDVRIVSPTELRLRHGSRAELVGARELTYKGEPVVEVVYECCGQHLMVVLAHEGTPAAKVLKEAAAEHRIQNFRPVGHAVAGVVGHHRVPELLQVVTAGQSRV